MARPCNDCQHTGRFCGGHCHGKRKRRRLKLPRSLGDMLGSPTFSDLGDDSYAEKLAQKEPYKTFIGWVKTAGDARKALGIAADLFRKGYDQSADVTILAGARSQAKSLLDNDNAYAMRVYSELPPGNSEVLDMTTRAKVAEALKTAVDDLKSVGDLLNIRLDLSSLLSDSFENAFVNIPAKILGAAGKSFWKEAFPFILAAGVITAGVVTLRKKILPGVFS